MEMVIIRRSGLAKSRPPMKIVFQNRPWDLHVCSGYTLFVVVVLITLGVGNLAALLLVLFIPGYALVAALFPGNKGVGWVERIALSIGLSMAVVPLIGILLNFTSGGIRFVPMLAAIALFILLLLVVAYSRRLSLPPLDRLAASFDLLDLCDSVTSPIAGRVIRSRIDVIDQVMRHASPFGLARLGRSDLDTTIDLDRVKIDDLAIDF